MQNNSLANSIIITRSRKGACSVSREVEFKNRDRFVELGITIAALRKMRGMSQEELAEKANISRFNLSAIEAPNMVRGFSLETLYNIADALEIRPGDLLNATLLPTADKAD